MNDTDQDLLHTCLNAHGRFSHAAHVHFTWLLLDRHPVLEALARLRAALQHLAAEHGQPQRYHETLTVASFLLVLDRRARSPGTNWEDFVARNPDLLDAARTRLVLADAYPGERLNSPLARAQFVPPA